MIMNWKDLLIVVPVVFISVFFLFFGVDNWDYMGFVPRVAVVFTCIIGIFILLIKSDELTARMEKLDELRSLEGVTDVRIPFFGNRIEFEYLSKPAHLNSNLLHPKFTPILNGKGHLHCIFSAEDAGPDEDLLEDEALKDELELFNMNYGLLRAERKNNVLYIETMVDVDLDYNRETSEFSNAFILDSLRLVHHLRERD